MQITNDAEFKQALNGLDADQRRVAGALFVGNVLPLTDDESLQRAVVQAQDISISAEELETVFAPIKRTMIDSRTRCGADGDWQEQASHFVIRAANAIPAPGAQSDLMDSLWQVVQNCRMARNCALIAADSDTENTEAQSQYALLEQYLSD